MAVNSQSADQLAILAMEYVARGLPVPLSYRNILGPDACLALDELERLTNGRSEDGSDAHKPCILAETSLVGSA